MSSPTNIVVVITGVYTDKNLDSVISSNKFNLLKRMEEKHNEYYPNDPFNVDNLRHTDQAILNFFDNVRKGYIDGAEGTMITWGYAGNYINPDDFMDYVKPFIDELLLTYRFCSVTFMFQSHDMQTQVYKLDGVHKSPYQINPRLHVHEECPFSFDVEIDKLSLKEDM